MASFEELMAEGLAAPFSGWDFSWLDRRSVSTTLPWSYRECVQRYAAGRSTMLDMGTGGGEWLSRLEPRPARTVATECWLPNVAIAARELHRLDIPVVQAAGAPDNMATDRGSPGDGMLPFGDETLGLVINRHESFDAAEVHRVLMPGGIFVTQQVDFHSYDDLYRVLGIDIPAEESSWLPLARQQVSGAGLTVLESVRGGQVRQFADIAGIVYYARAIFDMIGGQGLEAFRPALRRAFEQKTLWPVPIRQRCFLLVASKPQ
jgi:SAM-dependent methyltransferase